MLLIKQFIAAYKYEYNGIKMSFHLSLTHMFFGTYTRAVKFSPTFANAQYLAHSSKKKNKKRRTHKLKVIKIKMILKLPLKPSLRKLHRARI